MNSHQNLIEKIIKKGAFLNIRDNLHKTPLHIAAEIGNTEIVRLFVENGSVLDLKDHFGKRAIDLGFENGHFKG